MSYSEQLWMVLRLPFIAIMTWQLVSFPRTNSDLDWTACGVISIICGVGLFLCLLVARDFSPIIDWSAPFSLTKPFYPLKENVLRVMMMASISFVLGGIVVVLQEVYESGKQVAFGATWFFLGIAILCAIFGAQKIVTKP